MDEKIKHAFIVICTKTNLCIGPSTNRWSTTVTRGPNSHASRSAKISAGQGQLSKKKPLAKISILCSPALLHHIVWHTNTFPAVAAEAGVTGADRAKDGGA